MLYFSWVYAEFCSVTPQYICKGYTTIDHKEQNYFFSTLRLSISVLLVKNFTSRWKFLRLMKFKKILGKIEKFPPKKKFRQELS
jgi:hypothetical protein